MYHSENKNKEPMLLWPPVLKAKLVTNQRISHFKADSDSQTLWFVVNKCWSFTSYPKESISPGFKHMTVQLLPPAQRQGAGFVQLTKCSLSKRPESRHPLPQLRSPLGPRHASISKDSFAFLLSASLFTPVHFCLHQAWWKSTLFLFIFAFCHSCSPVFSGAG